MPIYEYLCNDCRATFEKTLTISVHDKEQVVCPKCASNNVVQEPATFYAVTSRKSA